LDDGAGAGAPLPRGIRRIDPPVRDSGTRSVRAKAAGLADHPPALANPFWIAVVGPLTGAEKTCLEPPGALPWPANLR
jgi:hypothetical protein